MEKEKEKEEDTSPQSMKISLSDNEGDDAITLTGLSYPPSPSRSSTSFLSFSPKSSSAHSHSRADIGGEGDVSQKIKLIIVGDNVDGHKTKLLAKYTKDDTCSAFDAYNYRHALNNGTVIAAYLYDTYGREDYNHLRFLQYDHTDVVIFLYSVSDPASYDNIKDRWYPEIKHYCPDALCVLVASGIEIRNDPLAHPLAQPELAPISFEKGAQLAEKIEAAKFFECSVVTGESVDELFNATIELGVQRLPVIPLIKELRQYAKKRAAQGEGFKFFWGDAFGGKPGADKVQAATNLANDLEAHGIDLQKEYSQDELDTILEGTLGDKVKMYPGVVASLKRNVRIEPVAESGNLQPAKQRLSH